jgi:hypothetical protein
MYVIPILVLALLAIGIFFGPLLAVILLAIGVIVFGGLKFFSPNVASESAPPPPQTAPPANAPGAAATRPRTDEEGEGGLWGETWPEEREQEDQGTEAGAS